MHEYLAERLIADTLAVQNITADQLTIHADRGSSMTSRTVAQLLSDLGVTRSHSRPRVSNNDNPFSEAYKTLKYRPDFPDRFTSIEQARLHCKGFFWWYNMSTTIAAWGGTIPPTSTMNEWKVSTRPARRYWPMPTPATPNGSCASHPPRR